MNYRSQLKGWAVDRVIEMWKATPYVEDGKIRRRDIEYLKELADELTVYCYVADKDFKDTIAYVSQLLKESTNPLEKITQMQSELAVIQEDIERQISLMAATNKSNGQAQESIQ